jgi:methionyl aminopeptidase
MSVVVKNQEEVGKMRLAGRLAAEVLDYIAPYVKPGVTTGKLNDLCHAYMVGVQGTVPAPLNYAPPGYKPFPSRSAPRSTTRSATASRRPGAQAGRRPQHRRHRHQGWLPRRFQPHVPRRRTGHPGAPSGGRDLRVHVARHRAGAAGRALGDIGAAIQAHAEQHGFSIVREFCGHGIGRSFHEEPQVLHYGKAGTGLKLEAGMTSPSSR